MDQMIRRSFLDDRILSKLVSASTVTHRQLVRVHQDRDLYG